jgi:hypothetical protein
MKTNNKKIAKKNKKLIIKRALGQKKLARNYNYLKIDYYIMNDNFKIIIIKNNVSKTIFAKNKITLKKENGFLDNLLDRWNLEHVPYDEIIPKSKKTTDSDLSEECPICKCNYLINEYKTTLNCKHAYHKKCINKWLKDSINCPICRTDIDN